MPIKSDVDVLGIRPETVLAIAEVREVFRDHGAALVVTSVSEGEHSDNSRHYAGLAFDCRRWELPPGQESRVVEEIRSALPGFRVILEETHIHVAYYGRKLLSK